MKSNHLFDSKSDSILDILTDGDVGAVRDLPVSWSSGSHVRFAVGQVPALGQVLWPACQVRVQAGAVHVGQLTSRHDWIRCQLWLVGPLLR